MFDKSALPPTGPLKDIFMYIYFLRQEAKLLEVSTLAQPSSEKLKKLQHIMFPSLEKWEEQKKKEMREFMREWTSQKALYLEPIIQTPTRFELPKMKVPRTLRIWRNK